MAARSSRAESGDASQSARRPKPYPEGLELAARFDTMVLLHIDLATMLARLDDPARGNDFGRAGHSREYLISGFERWQANLQQHADMVVDAIADLDTVTRQVAHAAARPG